MTLPLIYRVIGTLTLGSLLLAAPAYSAQQRNTREANRRSAAPAESSAPAQSSKAGYVIGDDDLLGINVWNEPAFTQSSLPVRSDGRIALPLIGTVEAAGRTPSQLEAVIAKKLETYIHHPNVTVMVLKMNSRSFNILGRVAKPGSYPLLATTTVLDALADAGGFTDFAKKKKIYVLRQQTDGHEIRLPFNYNDVIKGTHSEENILLEPHDTVVVP